MFDDEDQDDDKVTTNTDRLLMSEELQGMVPELESIASIAVKALDERIVKVVAFRFFGDKQDPMVGTLRSIMTGKGPIEVEFVSEIDEAFKTMEGEGVSFGAFEVHRGDRVVPVVGPFRVLNIRLSELEPMAGTCLIGISCERVPGEEK